MMTNPLITIHYADGTPSEIREMTDEEVVIAFPDGVDTATNAD
jgi:hypothetical protein